MAVESYKCPNCGAPVNPVNNVCAYCLSPIVKKQPEGKGGTNININLGDTIDRIRHGVSSRNIPGFFNPGNRQGNPQNPNQDPNYNYNYNYNYGNNPPPPPQNPAQAHADKSQIVAAILALFLGIIGIHWFYLGRGGKGVLYIFLMFITSGIAPLIMSILDAVRFFTMSNDRFIREYCRRR